MHLIPRRAARHVLVLLIAMGSLLAVPAFAFAHSDLSLVKVVDHAEAAPGDLLTYTLLIEQHGTHASPAGTVTDTLPPHTTFVSASAGCTAAGAVITCPIGPVAVGQSLTLTVTVRVDADVPAGDLLNVADVTAPNDTPTTNNHGSAISMVHFAGLGDFVWWDQNHDGLQGAGEPGFAGVTVHLYDSAGALVGTTTTDATGYYRFDRLRPVTIYSVCLDAPADSAPGGPLSGFELTTPNAGTDDAIDSDAELRNGSPCIAVAAPARQLVRPDLRLRFLEAGGDRRPGLGGREPQRHPGHRRGRSRRSRGRVARRERRHDRARRHRRQRPLPLRPAPARHLQRLLRGRHDPRGLRADHEGLQRLDARERLRRRRDGCAVSTVLAPGQRDLDWDAGIWKTPPPPRPAAPRACSRASRS